MSKPEDQDEFGLMNFEGFIKEACQVGHEG
jgi:hypothetical protein